MGAGLPLVHRIVVDGDFAGARHPLILELDRPAPENCYLQFYRYSKKTRNRGSLRGYSIPSKYAFRGVFVDGNSNNFPVIPIPVGETVVTLNYAEWRNIYRPLDVRGYWRDWNDPIPGRPRWNPINGQRDSKTIYKFGTCEYIRGESFRASQMSADTLTIMHYYATYANRRVAQERAILH